MSKSNPPLIDKIIFAFLVIFAASLTNSIFVNQIGYYGALFFLLVKYFTEKENPFKRNGLEYYFVAFLIAEFISAIFSVEPAHAFHNFLKRLLLIPVVYVMTAVAINPKRVSKLFYTFLYFSIISSLLYLWNSYSFYLRGLFQLTGSGPFLFHYPITTSELFSFTSLILFPFVIQKNLILKKRIFYLLAFIITILSLLATFKRTGWIGFAAGLVVIIIMKRKYIYLLPFVLGVIVLSLTQKSVSSIELFSFKPELKPIAAYETKGQVEHIDLIGDELFISDYDGGLIKYENQLQSSLNFDVPVVEFKHWQDNFYVAKLIDTRFVLVGKNKNNEFVELDRFMSSGMTKDFEIANGSLYILDVDSGLTVIENPFNLKNRRVCKQVRDFKKLLVINNNIILFSKAKGVYTAKIIDGEVAELRNILDEDKSVISVNSAGDKLIVQTKNKFYVFNENLELLGEFTSELPEVIELFEYNNKIFATLLGGDFIRLSFNDNSISVKQIYSFGYNPKSIVVRNDTLFAAHSKRSRLSSIFDPYLPANANRVALWRAGIKMFLDHPLFGVGDIDLAELYKQYKRPEDKEIQGHLHNNYFHFLAILGIIGFIAVMALLIKIFILLLQTVRKYEDDTFENTLALGFVGVFVSFLVAGLTEWNFGDHEIITFIWFVVGMALSLKKIKVKV